MSDSFSVMLNSINNYITKMEEDHLKIVALEKERTSLFQNVTHELKTPLATISGYAQIIGEDDFSDREFLKKAASRIHSESNRLNDLVTQLLTMSKENNLLEKTEVDVSEMLQMICEDFIVQTNEKQVTFAFDLRPLQIVINENELKQIFINLIDNAIKYSKEKSTITITVNETITIRNEFEKLDAKVKDQLFLPFNRVNKANSHGLGLFITKQLVEKNGGRIRATVTDHLFEIEIAFLS